MQSNKLFCKTFPFPTKSEHKLDIWHNAGVPNSYRDRHIFTRK